LLVDRGRRSASKKLVKWRRSSVSSNRTALTLLEVVAAIAILATLLVLVLAAQDRLARQSKRAELRLVAVNAADQLLREWSTVTPMAIPAASGSLNTQPVLYWKLPVKPAPHFLPLGMQPVRLVVSDKKSTMGDTDIPLAQVEFLTTGSVPVERQP
jgi:type II secretory pathway pseudopilin PulG